MTGPRPTISFRLTRVALGIVWKILSRVMASARLSAVVGKVTPGRGLSARRYRVAYDGHFLYAGSLDRLLALYLWKYGVIEAFELERLRPLVAPGSVVFDVGANIGFHAVQFAKWAGPAGHVYAFEPEPENFAILQANIAAAGLTNVTALQQAVSDAPGRIEMYVSPNHRGDHRIFRTPERRDTITVESTTLDAVGASQPGAVSLVKIDVQGAEALVLRGMRQLAAAHPGASIVLEFSPGLMREMACEPREVIDELAALGRPIEQVDEASARLIPCTIADLQRVSDTERYVNLLVGPAAGHTARGPS